MIIIKKEDFKGKEFNSLMAKEDGRRLWVTYRDGVHYFIVEDLHANGKIVCQTNVLDEAIRSFNELWRCKKYMPCEVSNI